MSLSQDLQWRGLIKDHTFSKTEWLDEPKTFYHGVDCSSDSLTIGNLAVLMLAGRLIAGGWQGIILIGGATSLVGDPGGKEEERDLKTTDMINKNAEAITAQIKNLFKGTEVTFVNNLEWLRDIKYLDFLREVGKHYSMTELTQRDYINDRMGESGSGISYAEFSYTLLQGYDFWQLNKNYSAELQIGGSDQWGNMLSGIPLIRKKENAEAHVLTMPLVIDRSSGRKFGKSEQGAVWLDGAKTSPYQFYQFWLNSDDQSVVEFLKIYTLLSKDDIEQLIRNIQQAPGERQAQKALAKELTSYIHGLEIANRVEKISTTLFGGQDYGNLTPDDFQTLKQELPVVKANINKTPLVDVLVQSGLADSNAQARRYLQENAVYINGQQFSVEKANLESSDSLAGHAVLRRGKNSSAIIELS